MTTREQATPGPWRVTLNVVFGADEGVVAECPTRGVRDTAELHANARLIAAAPDLAMSIRVILETAQIDADDARIAMDALAEIRHECRRMLATLNERT